MNYSSKFHFKRRHFFRVHEMVCYRRRKPRRNIPERRNQWCWFPRIIEGKGWDLVSDKTEARRLLRDEWRNLHKHCRSMRDVMFTTTDIDRETAIVSSPKYIGGVVVGILADVEEW